MTLQVLRIKQSRSSGKKWDNTNKTRRSHCSARNLSLVPCLGDDGVHLLQTIIRTFFWNAGHVSRQRGELIQVMSVKIALLAKKAWTASFCCFCRKQVIPCFSNKLGRKFFCMDFLIYSTEDWLLEWPEQCDVYGITVDWKSLVFLKQHKEGCDGGWIPRYIHLKKFIGD